MKSVYCGYIKETLAKQSKIITVIAVCWVLSLLLGMATAQWAPESVASWLSANEAAASEGIETIFGRFRDSLREGNLGTIATCILIVFAINMLGSIGRSLSTVFIFPLLFVFFSAWAIGVAIVGLQASSFLSLFLFLLMAGMEWVTYVLSASAGTNIGLAIISPKRVDCASRWAAFKHTMRQAVSLYAVIVFILAFQAVFEILYLRKVLLMGGTGAPLTPW